MVPLKYLSNFWTTLEMPLVNYEICLQLKRSNDPVVTLSTKQLESCFKRTINWNKYQPKKTNQVRSRYLDFLIDASFQGVNRHFALSFKDENVRESYKHLVDGGLNIIGKNTVNN